MASRVKCVALARIRLVYPIESRRARDQEMCVWLPYPFVHLCCGEELGEDGVVEGGGGFGHKMRCHVLGVQYWIPIHVCALRGGHIWHRESNARAKQHR